MVLTMGDNDDVDSDSNEAGSYEDENGEEDDNNSDEMVNSQVMTCRVIITIMRIMGLRGVVVVKMMKELKRC